MTVWFAIPLSYLLGSIPSAIWFSRVFSRLDIRDHGSKNAGLTNVYRVLGWKPALPVALVDFAKGLGAVLLGAWWSRLEWGSANETFALGCGLAAILGHTFTAFAGFRGGKGVLTAMGVFVGIAPVPALAAFAVWLVVLRRSGFVSLASILAALALGIFNTVLVVVHLLGYAASTSVEGALSWSSLARELVRHGDTNLFLLSWAAAFFVVWKHRPNIRRLRAGTEYRFGRGPREDSEQVRSEGIARFRENARRGGLDPEAVAVVGAGSWGIAIAQILSSKGLKVRLWEYSPKVAVELDKTRELPDKLPGVKLSESVEVTSDLARAVEGAGVVCLVVPSHTLRGVCTALSSSMDPRQVASRQWVSFIKGVEEKTLKRMTEIVREVLPGATEANVSVLSGPSHAEEVARQVPTTVVVASRDEETAAALQEIFFLAPYFRTYRSTDVVGVELCGAVKNVIAIASGILDGLGLGDNTRGALMTRGMVEMARLGEKLGGKRESFFGLAGMGDLITTCISQHSRNRFVGEQVGKGRPLQEVLSGMTMVAEGVRTVAGVRELARVHHVEMPLTEQVYRVLFEGKPALDGVEALMARAARAELE